MVFVFSEENLDFSSICKKIKRTKFCKIYTQPVVNAIYIYIYIDTQGSFNAYFLNFMVRISVKLVTARHKSMELGTTIEKIRDLMHVMMVSKSRWKCNCVP